MEKKLTRNLYRLLKTLQTQCWLIIRAGLVVVVNQHRGNISKILGPICVTEFVLIFSDFYMSVIYFLVDVYVLGQGHTFKWGFTLSVLPDQDGIAF